MKYLLENEETSRINFRKVDISDFIQWLAFFKDPSSFEHWTGQFEAPEIECKKWYQRQFERYENDEGGMNALIEKNSEKLIGHCGLLVQIINEVKELEIGYSLLPSFRNKGFATEAAKKCIDFGFENNFAESLISIISLTNSSSANVAIKNGMKLEEQSVYKENQVNIFRIRKTDWFKIKAHEFK